MEWPAPALLDPLPVEVDRAHGWVAGGEVAEDGADVDVWGGVVLGGDVVAGGLVTGVAEPVLWWVKAVVGVVSCGIEVFGVVL